MMHRTNGLYQTVGNRLSDQWTIGLTDCQTKAQLHQRRSNLGSAEPRSPVNGDLNRVQVTFRCTNLNLVQPIVDQLIDDLNRGYNVDNVDWLQTVTSYAMFCLRASA